MPTTVVRQEVPLFTEQWDAHLDEAFEYLRAEQPDAAYEAFMRHLQSHPGDENAYEGAIVALLQQTRWDEAQQLVERGRAACPNSAVLAARQTWLWVYLTQESQAYPLVVQLLEAGFRHPDWLRETVLPLRNVLICHASDPRLVSSNKQKCQQERATLLKGIQTLEHWLERYQFPIPDEPVGVKITLSMIARNEAEYLEECLQSVQGVVDEIVLVDTGSTDATPQIAERYGAKVIHAEWQNDFAAARNIALQHATGDWILVLDADERLTPESKQAILNAARHPQFVGYYLEILNEIREGDYFVHRLVRLFRRMPYARWEGAIHEQIIPSLVSHKGRIATVAAQVRHLGYSKEVMRSRDKAQRNIEIILRELEQDPDDLFHKFNLANTYFALGDYEQAAYWAEQTCPYLRGDEDYAGQIWANWVESLTHLEQYESALQVGADALARGIDHPMVHYTLAAWSMHGWVAPRSRWRRWKPRARAQFASGCLRLTAKRFYRAAAMLAMSAWSPTSGGSPTRAPCANSDAPMRRACSTNASCRSDRTTQLCYSTTGRRCCRWARASRRKRFSNNWRRTQITKL
jgi:glycosyltransferase involved in cell wall biosynthesis